MLGADGDAPIARKSGVCIIQPGVMGRLAHLHRPSIGEQSQVAVILEKEAVFDWCGTVVCILSVPTALDVSCKHCQQLDATREGLLPMGLGH